jgi:hypothetical protein
MTAATKQLQRDARVLLLHSDVEAGRVWLQVNPRVSDVFRPTCVISLANCFRSILVACTKRVATSSGRVVEQRRRWRCN